MKKGFSKKPVVDNKTINLKGSYDSYDITIIGDQLKIIDNNFTPPNEWNYTGVAGGLIKNIAFSDIGEVRISKKLPLHVADVINSEDIDSVTFNESKLLENDKDWFGLGLKVANILNPVGGTIERADGVVTFKMDADYEGMRYFTYQVKNGNNNLNTKQIPVYIKDPHLPNDPGLFKQWHLFESRVTPLWKDYLGSGVKIQIFDDNLIFKHRDLPEINSEEFEFDYDSGMFAKHALAVTSVILAQHNNKLDIAGIAPNAEITSIQVPLGIDVPSSSFLSAKDHDVINCSWGGSDFGAEHPDEAISQIKDAVITGRDGRGSIIVFASGNSKDQFDTNFEVLGNSPFVINVGGYNKKEDGIGTHLNTEEFATESASVLISAPAQQIPVHVINNMRINTNSGQIQYDDSYALLDGTSFAAPIVSGVIALMLEANPKLGWRDVQSILAYSAFQQDHEASIINAAKTYNGGGFIHNNKFGFGAVDAFGAVRLAEVWTHNSTYDNYFHSSGNLVHYYRNKKIEGICEEKKATYSYPINNYDDVEIESIQLSVDLALPKLIHNDRYSFNLITPQKTVLNVFNSTFLLNTSDIRMNENGGFDVTHFPLKWEFSLTAGRGEAAKGTWQFVINDSECENKASDIHVRSLNLKTHGHTTPSTEMIYTNVFKDLYNKQRAVMPECIKTVNFAAINRDSQIDLQKPSFVIFGKPINLGKNHSIVDIKAGDGDDILIGNDSDNIIAPGRGDDKITLGGGADLIWYPSIDWKGHGSDTVYDFNVSEDKIKIGGSITYSDLTIDSGFTDEKQSFVSYTYKDWSLTINGVLLEDITSDMFIFV